MFDKFILKIIILTFYTDGSLQIQNYNNLRQIPLEERYTVLQSAAFIKINSSI